MRFKKEIFTPFLEGSRTIARGQCATSCHMQCRCCCSENRCDLVLVDLIVGSLAQVSCRMDTSFHFFDNRRAARQGRLLRLPWVGSKNDPHGGDRFTISVVQWQSEEGFLLAATAIDHAARDDVLLHLAG